MGPEIIAKAIGLIARNFGVAVRASAAPILLYAAIALVLAWPVIQSVRTLELGQGIDPDVAARFTGTALLLLALYGIAFCWVAVAWHRYVLLEEDPGLVPTPQIGPMLRYAGTAILIGLILVALMIPVLFLVGLAIAALGPDVGLFMTSAFGFGIGVLVGYVGLRFAVALPAKAVGAAFGLGAAWRTTARASGAILTVAVLLAALNLVFQLVSGALGTLGWAGLALGLAVTWFSTLLGVSVLTTLYGHLVEGRPV